MISLLVVAPTPVARAGWRALLAPHADGGLVVSAEAATAADVGRQVDQARPDVVLIDPANDAGALLSEVRALTAANPGLRVLWLGEPRADAAVEALSAGAHGYLRLAATGQEVAAAVTAIHHGLIVLDPAAAGPLLDRVTGAITSLVPAPEVAPKLSARETQVLQLLAAGLTNRGIARHLNMSEHTAKFHIGSILSKLGAASRAEAVAVAARAGLLLQ